MNTPEIKLKIREGLKNSEKWNKIKNNKKNTTNRNYTEENKNKLKQMAIDYFNNNENIIKHRDAMAKSSGIKIVQYDMENNFINKFISINEASRQIGISSSSISLAIRKNTNIAGNYIWKKEI
jgi:hypothetical protein